jgi:hypothetical protein
LTTEKDWVRIDGKIGVDLDIAILTIKIGFLSGPLSIPEQADERRCTDTFFDIIRQGIIRSKRTLSH